MTDDPEVAATHAEDLSQASTLSRRGFLGVGAGLLGAGALGAAGVASATVAEAAGGDRVLHLVRRTTYGPTPELLATVRRVGPDAWLERQLHPGKVPDAAMTALLRRWPTLRMTPAQLTARIGKFHWDGMFDLCDAHIARAAWSNRQLFEVMVDFWSNHLNVTCPSSDVWSTRHLYDAQVIRRHALGRFSDMLVASAKHPAMLTYLDNASSDKDAPNENYARELLELHTVGVGAGYTEAMVKSAARLLTGLSVDDRTGAYLYDTSKHATGPVRVLGFTDPNRSTYGEKVAVAYLRYLATHPATARHLARKLAVRFVSDTPSAALVAHLAKVYLAHDTAIVPVLRALFRSREFTRSAGDKVKRPFEETGCRKRVAPPPRASAGGSETLSGAHGKRSIGLTELLLVLDGLLKVVADDLVQLDEVRRTPIEPLREPFVEFGTRRLRERLVSGVADQEVPETEAVLTRQLRAVGTDQLPANERSEPRGDVLLVGRERLDGAEMEDLAFDRSALEHAALGAVELVEPGGEQGSQRRGNLHVLGFTRHREHLGEKERVAARRARDPLT